MRYRGTVTLVAAVASSPAAVAIASAAGASLYDLARRDCPVNSPGIPQYLRCITECRVSSEDEDEQRGCVGEKCSHICKPAEERDL